MNVMLVGYIISDFVLYILAYRVVLHARVNTQKIRWILAICMLTLIHAVIYRIYGERWTTNLTLFSMLVIPILLLDRSQIRQNILLYPFVVIESSVVTICISFILAAVTGVSEHDIVEDYSTSLLCQVLVIVLLLILGAIYRFNKQKIYTPKLDKYQFVIYYIVMISTFLIVAPLQALASESSNNFYINTIAASLSTACVILIAVTLWQGILSQRESMLHEKNSRQRDYMMLQKKYYEELLNRDNQLRKFRHDINAHIGAIKGYLDTGDYNGLQEYFRNISEETFIDENSRITGNIAVDAMLSPIFVDIVSSNIEISTKGQLPRNLSVDEEYSLCTILYNLIMNAFEACKKIDDGCGRIDFFISKYNEQTIIRVENTVKENIVIEGNVIGTSKEDKINHGIGTQNVYDMVTRRNGTISYECRDKKFCVEVVIALGEKK